MTTAADLRAHAAVRTIVPTGWKLVPIEPTREMLAAEWNVSLSDAHTEGGVEACAWAAMLNAAPEYVPEDDGGLLVAEALDGGRESNL